MDFSQVELTSDQLVFEKEIRELISQNWTPNLAHIAVDHDRMPTSVRMEMSRHGWIHPELAVEAGGAGLGEIELEMITNLFDEYYIPANVSSSLLIFQAVCLVLYSTCWHIVRSLYLRIMH